MEAALVSASMGVMKPLLSKLTSLLGAEYALFKGVRKQKQIKFMRDELSAMDATLQMLANAEQLSPQMKDWRDKVRELAYDIEDCIDAYMARADHERDGHIGILCKLKKMKKLMKKLIWSRKFASQCKEIKARVTEESERHKRYNFVEPASNSSTFAIDPRLPALYEEVDKLVGIDGPKDHIIEWFNKDIKNEDLKMLSIVGSGGLGKTTLANQVYCQIKGPFDCKAFVSVSRNPCVKKILRQMLKEVGISSDSLDDEPQLIDRIRDHLKDKRYLFVIDDVWDIEAWKYLSLALFNNKCGSRIIVTTRNVDVASCSSSDGGYVYPMKGLSVADSKKLFCRRAFGSDELCYPHLERVCYDILEKCDGLPLAIITLSSLLADQLSKDEWNRVLASIGRALAKGPDAGNMTKILSLSYFDLPHHLRTCFLYLSAFPEDYSIGKQRLINRWIAEGFVREEQGRSAYETGQRYFNDLINRSLIQPVDLKYGKVSYKVERKKYGEAQACRVHDIILDFITCRAIEENFVTLLDAADHGQISDYRVRRLSLKRLNKNEITIPSTLSISQIRSLTIFGPAMQTSLLPFTALRVLDLEDCQDLEDHHLANIERLFLLKYLHLSSKSITNLPAKIGELQYLETLDIRGTMIEELPSTITKLQRLARLYVHVRTRIQGGLIGKMQSLEELQTFGVCSYEVGISLQEFSKLTKLRTLKLMWGCVLPGNSEGRRQVEDLQSCVAKLIISSNLHHLYIMGFLKSFQPLSLDSLSLAAPCSLRKLNITFCFIDKVPDWMGSLGNLRELQLYIYCIRPEDVDILGEIPNLLFLELGTSGGTNGRIIFNGNNRFRSLKYLSLNIGACGNVLEFEAGSMPKVEHLQLQFYAHMVECLNGASGFGIQHLSTLTEVEVTIRGYCFPSTSTDVAEYFTSAIETAVKELPNRPTITFRNITWWICTRYDSWAQFIGDDGALTQDLEFEETQTAAEMKPWLEAEMKAWLQATTMVNLELEGNIYEDEEDKLTEDALRCVAFS